MSNFPEKIWDGCSPSRSNLTDVQPPGYNDWCTIIAELQATQRYLLNLVDNLETMPNLNRAIKDGENSIASCLIKIKKLTPPPELKKDIEETKKRVDKLESLSKRLDTLIRLVQALQQQLFTLTADYQKFKNNVEKHAQGAENRIRLRVDHFEKAINKRIEALTIRVNDVSELLSFQPIS
jgi:DNA repair ATPase RecN